MGVFANKHYKFANISIPFLEAHGFKPYETSFYRKFFCVYKYFEFSILYAEITVNIDCNDAIIDIMDSSRARFAPFYCDTCSYLLDIISTKLNKEINDLGMEEKGRLRKRIYELPTKEENNEV